MRIVRIVLAALAVSGCAVGNRYDYAVSPDLAPKGTGSVVVATQDARPYVVSGQRPAHFVGYQRSGVGIPYTVGTASGLSLAEECNNAVAGGLNRRGFKTSSVTVDASTDVRALAARTGADFVTLVRIADWRTDTHTNVALYYEVTLQVFDAAGRQLATSRVSGFDNLGGNAFSGGRSTAIRYAGQAFRTKLQELFQAPAVITALR